MTIKVLAAACAAAIALLNGAPALAACDFTKIGELAVDMSRGVPTVEIEVNGVRKRAYINTGSDVSVLSEAGAALLGLPHGDLMAGRTSSASGETHYHRSSIPTLRIGNAFSIGDFEVLIGGTQPVTDDVVGSLGQDLLGASDVEFDLAHSRMAFFRSKGCGKEPLAYWEGGYAIADMLRPSPVNPRFQTYVQVNGRRLLAQLGTNLPFSVVDSHAAAVAGVKPDTPGVQSLGNIDFGAAHPVWLGTFQAFAIGEEKIENPKIAFSPLWDDARVGSTGSRSKAQVPGLPSIVLGLDFLKVHRVLLASSQGRMYFSFSGGTVFAAPGARPVVPGLFGIATSDAAFGVRR
jgi:hypothetical protein